MGQGKRTNRRFIEQDALQKSERMIIETKKGKIRVTWSLLSYLSLEWKYHFPPEPYLIIIINYFHSSFIAHPDELETFITYVSVFVRKATLAPNIVSNIVCGPKFPFEKDIEETSFDEQLIAAAEQRSNPIFLVSIYIQNYG